jgi:hypothetical protein
MQETTQFPWFSVFSGLGVMVSVDLVVAGSSPVTHPCANQSRQVVTGPNRLQWHGLRAGGVIVLACRVGPRQTPQKPHQCALARRRGARGQPGFGAGLLAPRLDHISFTVGIHLRAAVRANITHRRLAYAHAGGTARGQSAAVSWPRIVLTETCLEYGQVGKHGRERERGPTRHSDCTCVVYTSGTVEAAPPHRNGSPGRRQS